MVRLDSLFDIEYGQHEYNSKGKLEKGKTCLISSQSFDNGCYGFFDIVPKYRRPIITVPRTGSIGHAFVQVKPCCVDDNCLVLIPKGKNSLEYLYYVATKIRGDKWRYTYGRQITPNRLGRLEVTPPHKFTSELNFEILRKKVSPKGVKKCNISIKKMRNIPITKLCHLDRKYAPYLNKLDRAKEMTPYVTTTSVNNGIALYCGEEPNFEKDAITISLDGRCGTTFYQFDSFMAGEKTAVLRLKEGKDPHLLMYIATLIRIKSWRYHYGRKLSMGRLLKCEIPFPITKEGDIDLETIRKLVKNTYGSELFEKYSSE